MDRIKKKLRSERHIAPGDRATKQTVVQLTDALSASNLVASRDPEDPDGLGLKVWSEPTVDNGPLVDIIFVHGLTGKRTKTWLADGAAKPWPEELLSKKIPEARIVTYGYDADVVHFTKPAGQNTVLEHARNLVGDLTNLRLGTSSFQRPLILVAHSLGGLVVEQAIVLSYHDFEAEHQLSDSLHGIVFLGTPHAGSDLSKFALALGYFIKFSMVKSPNTSNLAVLKKESEVLAGIQDSFSKAITKRERLEKKQLEIHCCIEEIPIKGLGHRVVEPASAEFPGPHTSCTIPADHMGMTKIQHSSQVGYTRLSERLRRWVDVIREDTSHLGKDIAQQSAYFLMPFAQDKDFVGREDIFTSLDKGFSQSASLQRMALAGLGGIGESKSQIAIEYAYRLRKRSPAKSVFWVHANNAVRFEQSYRSIATTAKIPGIEDPKVDVLNLVFQWLGSGDSGDWLLILDNADDADMFFSPHAVPTTQEYATNIEPPCLSRFLPQTGSGSTLITSRDEGTALRLTGERKQVLRVDVMSEDDTVALLTKRLPEDASDESAKKELIVELDSIPLAITQASAYINVQGTRMTIAKYLDFLRRDEKSQIHLLSKDEADLRRDPGVPNSVIRTWQISFSQIKDHNPAAADLLSCMCMLDRQGIPEFLFCKDGDQSLGFEEAIGILIRFSFVIEEKEQGGFEIHRLVQLATRKWIESFGEILRVQEEALRLIWHHYPVEKYENWLTCEALEPHAQIVLNYTLDSKDCKLQQKTLLHNGARFALRQGRFNISEERVKRAIDIGKAYLKSDDLSTIASSYLLAWTYRDQGRWKEGEELDLQVLEARKRILGAQHPETMNSMSSLASTYWNQGRWTEAEKLYLQVLEMQKKVLGEDHPETIISIGNLATIYCGQGRWTEAEKLYLQVLETRKEVLGDKHPATLTSMNNLATLYNDQGRWMEAEELNLQVLETMKEVLGDNHPGTLTSTSNLASIYRSQNKLTEAEELDLKMLKSSSTVLGAEHPETLTTMSNLACTYHRQDRHSEAIELMEKVVELREKKIGANHPDTIASIKALARWKDH